MIDMTDEQAIEFLQSRLDLIELNYPELEDYAQALKIAIKALEKVPFSD